MRKLLVLALVAGVLAAGDAWVRATAERRVATELARSLMTDRPSVSLGGFPFVVRLASGTIPSARIGIDTIERRRLRLRDVRMILQDLRFSPSELAAGGAGSVAIRDGRGRATIEIGSFQEALREASRRLPVALEIEVGRRGLRGSVAGASGRLRLDVEGTDLVVGVGPLDDTFTVALPAFVDGLSYDSVRVTDSQILVEFSLTNATLRGG